MKRISGCGVLALLVVLALAAGGMFALVQTRVDPAIVAAKARQESAKAAMLEAKAAAAPQRERILTGVLAGLGVIIIMSGTGLGVIVIQAAGRRSRLIHPNRSGQFPLMRVSGPGWSGVIDPNRAPGNMTLIRGGTLVDAVRGRPSLPEVAQPLAISEAGHLQLAQYASGVAAIAAATMSGGAGRAALDVAAPMIRPQAIAAPLPEVEQLEPGHVERLLALSAPADDGSAIDGDFWS